MADSRVGAMPMAGRWGKKAIRIVGYVVAAVTCGYLVFSVASMDFSALRRISLARVTALAALLSLAYASTFCLLALAWKHILHFVSRDRTLIGFNEVLALYSKSNVAKYTPGNVMQFVIRSVLAVKYGFTHAEIALTTIIEMGLSVVVAFEMALAFNFERMVAALDRYARPVLANAPIVVVCLTLAVLAGALGISIARKRQRMQLETREFFSRRFLFLLLKVQAIYLGVNVAAGLSLLAIFVGVLGVRAAPATGIAVVGAFAFSAAVSSIVPGTSAGLGVRESLLLLLLAPIYGAENTLIAAFVHRLTCIGGDLCALGLGYAAARRVVSSP